MSYTTGTGQKLLYVHNITQCIRMDQWVCVIHNPLDGPWRDWPTHWREDRGIMERICPCGVGHPVAESYGSLPGYELIHGCCGCPCAPNEEN